MPSDLVLITGTTGHVGFKVLVDALKLGYSVRAAIREPSKQAAILATKSIQALNPGSRLSFVIVPEITADGAYDEAVKGVKYIIHIASPLAKPSLKPEEFEAEIIAPAVKGTIGMLQSAQKTTGIKRIAITSSVAAIAHTTAFLNESTEVFDENSTTDALPPPYPHPFIAYCTSKIDAHKATKEFIARETPAFDVVTLLPSFIIGKNELVTDPQKITDGTNSLAFRMILGENGNATAGCTVHVDDVAKAHILALDPKVPSNSDFILSSGGLDGTLWKDATDIVARNFPQAVAIGILPNSGTMETTKMRVDASKTEEAFGFKFLNFEEQVKSVTSHYLELVGANAA
jgi:nucleoside-diphosphate-sugar epimerase